MVFVMGSFCLLHSSPVDPLFSIPSYSSTSQSIYFFSPLRMAQNGRKNRKISASLSRDTRNGRSLCARKAILFVGFSFFPVLKMTAMALQSLASDGSDQKAPIQDRRFEKNHHGVASENPFVSVLSGLGILGSGVLAALYSLTLKEKATSEATIELMRNQIKEKEAALISMEKKFESVLMEEKELGSQQVTKVREEQQSLINRLKSANDTIIGLGRELQEEKKVVEELKVRIDDLQKNLMKAGEEKKELHEKLREKMEFLENLQEKINFLTGEIKEKDNNLQSLSSILADKEMELQKLSVTYQQLREQLASLGSENEELKDRLRKNDKELELQKAAVEELDAQAAVLLGEKDESARKFDSMQREFQSLKSSSEKKAAEAAKLFEDQAHMLHEIKQQLESTLSEVNRSKDLVADLSQERDDLKNKLDVELNNVKSLQRELQVTLENLEKSKNQATELARQLQQSRDLCFDLEAEVSKVRADFSEAKETMQKTTEETRRRVEILTGELLSVKELLKKETKEKQTVSDELAAVVQSREDLQKELDDVYKKAETSANDLLEEKASVAALKEKLKALEAQISEETEAQKSLEKDLGEALRSLDEINQNALIVSKELEHANAQISSVEDEKDAVYKSLAEQKQVSQEARENTEDAHILIMRLGQERESLEKRVKKLEGDLASAKGEILRLKAQTSSSKMTVNDQHQQTVEMGTKAAVPVKKTRRRRKTDGPHSIGS